MKGKVLIVTDKGEKLGNGIDSDGNLIPFNVSIHESAALESMKRRITEEEAKIHDRIMNPNPKLKGIFNNKNHGRTTERK